MPIQNKDRKRCDRLMIGKRRHVIREKCIFKKPSIRNMIYLCSIYMTWQV